MRRGHVPLRVQRACVVVDQKRHADVPLVGKKDASRQAVVERVNAMARIWDFGCGPQARKWAQEGRERNAMACSLGGASSQIFNGRIYIGLLPLHAPRNDPAQNKGVGIPALYYAYHVQCLRTAARWLKWSRRLRRVERLLCIVPCGRQRGRAMLAAKSNRRRRLLLVGAFASVGMWRAGPRGGGCGPKVTNDEWHRCVASPHAVPQSAARPPSRSISPGPRALSCS
jgi:hypothetical protein